MAITALTGVSGGFSMNAADGPSTVTFFKWTCRLIRQIIDDSNFGDATNARTKIGGMTHAEGTFEGVAAGSTPTLGTLLTEHESGPGTADWVMTLDSVFGTDMAIQFECMLRNVTTDTSKTDRIFVSGAFRSAGVIATTDFVKGVA